jgi:hypothetical protein
MGEVWYEINYEYKRILINSAIRPKLIEVIFFIFFHNTILDLLIVNPSAFHAGYDNKAFQSNLIFAIKKLILYNSSNYRMDFDCFKL